MGRGPKYLSVSTAIRNDNWFFKWTLLKTYEGLRRALEPLVLDLVGGVASYCQIGGYNCQSQALARTLERLI